MGTKINKAEFEALPEALKAKFKPEGDDAYVLQEEDVSGLKNKVEELKKEKLKFKHVEEAIADGFDLEKAKHAQAELDRLETEKLTKKGQWDELKMQLEERHRKEMEKVTAENAQILTNLKREKLTNVLTEKGVLPDRAKYLVHDLEREVELASDEKGFSLRKVGGIGDAMEFDALIDGVKQSSPFFFAPTGASGSGASGSQGNGNNGANGNGGGGGTSANVTPGYDRLVNAYANNETGNAGLAAGGGNGSSSN